MTTQSSPVGIGADYARQLLETQAQLDAWLETVDPALLYTRAAPDAWSVMQNLVHLVELQPYWAKEIEKVAGQPGSPFGRTQDDPARTGWVQAHAEDQLPQVREQLRAAAREAGDLLARVPDESWELTGAHHRKGAMTLRQIADTFLVHHLGEHVEQAHAAYVAAGGAKP